MKGKLLKIGSVVLASAVAAASLAGCGGDKNAASEGGKKLTYFAALTPQHAGATASNLSEIPMYQEMQKRTGVEIEFIHPATGQEKEQLNLLIASKELPDIVEYNWGDYPGGPQKAIDDNVILGLNDLIDNKAPNLKNYLANDTTHNFDKMIKTDDSNYYVFPFLRGDDYIAVFQGLTVRQDWLDEAGLEVPTTIDEWETMLAAFKARGDDVIPFTVQWPHLPGCRAFMGAYGVMQDFYLDNNKIVYGPMQDGYKQFLAKMADWYQKGYIDKDFSTQTSDNLEAKIMTDKAGSAILLAGSQIGKVVNNAISKNRTDFKIAGVPYPSLEKGGKARFGHKDNLFSGFGAAISATCKDPELAAGWLDYAYGEDGHMLYNFGIEGTSYNMEDGYPKYTDEIMHNPDGLSFAAALARYARSMGAAPMIQDKRYMEQYCSLPEQSEAVTTWMDVENDGILPKLTPPSEDSKRYSTIMSDVKTTVDEYTLAVILGQRSVDEFGSFVADLQKMGIEEATQIQEKALANYNNR